MPEASRSVTALDTLVIKAPLAAAWHRGETSRADEAWRESAVDRQVVSAVQSLAVGPLIWEMGARPKVDTMPVARRHLLLESLAPTEERLAHASDDRMLRTLYAASLVTLGRLEEGLGQAEQVIMRDWISRRALGFVSPHSRG